MRRRKSQQIIQFIETLKLPDGAYAGKPFRLREWQKHMIREIFDPVDETGYRLVRQTLLTMARKNAKTAFWAAIYLAFLCGPLAVPNGELYSCATTQEQAAILFTKMERIIVQDAELNERLNVRSHDYEIVDPESGSVYQALSADAKSKHGFSPLVVLFDELAQFGQDRRLYDVMTSGSGAHNEPLFIYIGTQAPTDQDLFSELIDYGKHVNEGAIVDPTFKAFIYETPLEADIFDEKNWYLSNPALGDFNSLAGMRHLASKARINPRDEYNFRNLNLNQRIDAAPGFIPLHVWNASGDQPDLEVFRNNPCHAGLDLSSKNDLSAFILVAQDPETKKWHVLCFFWTPGDNIRQRSERDRVPYDIWAKEGYLTATPGRTIDYEYIVRELADLAGSFDLRGIYYDRYKINDLLREFQRIEFAAWIDDGKEKTPKQDGLRLVEHGQGFVGMNPAIEKLEDELTNEQMAHGCHPVLTWCLGNVRLDIDKANNRAFNKKKSTGRIDGIVALAMAINGAMGPGPAKSTESVYETRGFLEL